MRGGTLARALAITWPLSPAAGSPVPATAVTALPHARLTLVPSAVPGAPPAMQQARRLRATPTVIIGALVRAYTASAAAGMAALS